MSSQFFPTDANPVFNISFAVPIVAFFVAFLKSNLSIMRDVLYSIFDDISVFGGMIDIY